MRYHGQSYEIETVLEADHVRSGDTAGMAESFHRRHRQVYDHADPEAAVQLINLRLVIVGASPKPQFSRAPLRPQPAVPSASARVYMQGHERDIPVFTRGELAPGHHFASPAIVTQSDCTTCIPPGYAAQVDAYRNLILSLSATAT